MTKFFGHPVSFALIYIVFMIPTYFLPFVGSNSYAINVAGQAAGAGMNPAFWLHLASLVVLVIITWIRGGVIEKKWIVIFPVLAAVFDLGPGVNNIPFIPTIMHLLAVVLGVALQPSPAVART